MDNTSEQEMSQERAAILAKMNNLEEFETKSMGKLLKADTADQAQEALLEHAFIMTAYWQLQAKIDRIDRDNGEIKESMEYANEYKGYYDSITLLGSWDSAKRALHEIKNDLQLPSRAREMGFDPNFIYKGEFIFGRDEHTTKYDTNEQYFAWQEFLQNKLDLIPDKTEPYTHPNIELLKDQIESV